MEPSSAFSAAILEGVDVMRIPNHVMRDEMYLAALPLFFSPWRATYF